MGSSSKSPSSSGDEDAHELRRGPWTLEEDTLLTHYISCHAEGHWNLLAKRSGLRRSGKSCRLRWLNYLKPDVKRGNLTPQEQLLILQLHAKWGNRWSKIALHLPGRTDNEIKNYWRTRVQKQARHLNIDSNSSAFQDMIRCSWMPRLLQKIQLSSSSPNISSHNLAASHAPIINNSSPSLPNVFPEGQFPMTENSISDSPSISSSGSMNFSHTSGMFSEYPSSPFSGMEVNTFLKGCNNVEDRGFYNDLKSSFDGMENYSLVSSMVQPEDFEESIRYCHADENKWMNGNNMADSLWNMDESWELRQLQARGT